MEEKNKIILDKLYTEEDDKFNILKQFNALIDESDLENDQMIGIKKFVEFSFANREVPFTTHCEFYNNPYFLEDIRVILSFNYKDLMFHEKSFLNSIKTNCILEVALHPIKGYSKLKKLNYGNYLSDKIFLETVEYIVNSDMEDSKKHAEINYSLKYYNLIEKLSTQQIDKQAHYNHFQKEIKNILKKTKERENYSYHFEERDVTRCIVIVLMTVSFISVGISAIVNGAVTFGTIGILVGIIIVAV